MFSSSVEVAGESYAFMHMAHCPLNRRDTDKRVARAISEKPGVILIPTPTECWLYDDKYLFHEKCGAWEPTTYYSTSKEEAKKALAKLNYPFVSKSKIGAGSSNVRLIKNEAQAHREIDIAFGDIGLPQFAGGGQKGYVLWQEFCDGNPNDWRVIIIAKKYGFVLKRFNRPNIPFASGSGRLKAISTLDDEIDALLNFTRNFAIENEFSFLGVDIVYGRNHKPVVLEITTGWSREGYVGCRVFEYSNGFKPTAMDGARNLFDIVVMGMEKGEF